MDRCMRLYDEADVCFGCMVQRDRQTDWLTTQFSEAPLKSSRLVERRMEQFNANKRSPYNEIR